MINKDMEIEKLLNEVEKSKNEIERLRGEIAYKDMIINSTLSYCNELNVSKKYKILQLVYKFIMQFLLGGIPAKRYFYGMCKRYMLGEGGNVFVGRDEFNFVLNISSKLNFFNIYDVTYNKDTVDINPNILPSVTVDTLSRDYNKADIIIFSVIDYDFRFQRPQHIAERFSKKGHRVFYINSNFGKNDYISKVSENLYVVNLLNDRYSHIYYVNNNDDFKLWLQDKVEKIIGIYSIKDAAIIVDYPHWIYGAVDLRDKYGFKIIVDFMDDTTGFLATASDNLKSNSFKMLESGDYIITSSDFLYNIAIKYNNNVCVVRNGTDVEHFSFTQNIHNKRPTIGYYGAISHWFDYEKVCYIAKERPQYDIILIGEILEYETELKKYDNIKLLGEKKYDDLPEYLSKFDVCLIPFDTSTDLIKATNPVKFYEYLSAGKKVVTTEIPELFAYKDKYVYMSNDNDEFLNYVDLCIIGKDILSDSDECREFAGKNDWNSRFEDFNKVLMASTPKVSIIVLTYNNYNLNVKCIESILSKTAYFNYELIIVDNLSTDGTIEYLKNLESKNIQNVKIIYNEKNLGFAGGNNCAIKEATGKYIVLLNNDTIVTRGWLTSMVKHLENDPNCGMIGSVTNSIGNEAMIPVNYTNISELDAFSHLYTTIHAGEVYRDVDRLAMFSTMIRKDILDNYGMLDDRYEVGMFEDDDYAMLVKAAGYDFYVVEDSFVHHVNNASFKKLHPDEYKKIFDRNRKIFENKWDVKWKMPKYRNGVSADTNVNMMCDPIES